MSKKKILYQGLGVDDQFHRHPGIVVPAHGKRLQSNGVHGQSVQFHFQGSAYYIPKVRETVRQLSGDAAGGHDFHGVTRQQAERTSAASVGKGVGSRSLSIADDRWQSEHSAVERPDDADIMYVNDAERITENTATMNAWSCSTGGAPSRPWSMN
jgi:hypothetical protein